MKILILLLALITYINCQRAGGGGLGRGSGSGYGYGGGKITSPSCKTQCSDQYSVDHDDKARDKCMDGCHEREILVVAIVVPIVGVLLLCFIYGCCTRWRICKRCGCCGGTREEMMMKLGIGEDSKFNASMDQVTQIMEQFKPGHWSMSYTEGEHHHVMRDVVAHYKILNANSLGFELKGYDSFGHWKAEGSINLGVKGVKLVMLKDYVDKFRARQGSSEHLVYASDFYNEVTRQFQGKWYYQNKQHDAKNSGEWIMTAGTQQVQNQNDHNVNVNDNNYNNNYQQDNNVAQENQDIEMYQVVISPNREQAKLN